METKDLMMGDWIQSPITPKPLKVAQINWDYSVECVGIDDMIRYHVGLGDIKPIPLTDEIMAKNFSQYSESYEPNFSRDYLITDIGATITYDVVTRLIGLPVRNIAGDWEFYSITEIRYVHQLQHALRLCGIEKEIII